jgi:hypothetical protein
MNVGAMRAATAFTTENKKAHRRIYSPIFSGLDNGIRLPRVGWEQPKALD